MSITTVHQAPGQFDLQLDRDAPEEIRALTARAYAALIVTASPITHPERISYANLLGLAQYVGIVKGRSDDRTTLSGYGPAILLNGPQVIYEQKVSSRPFYDGSNPSWIRSIVLQLGISENNGITVGSINSVSTGAKPGKIKQGQTRLEILGWVCRRFGKEWRINPDGTLDAGNKANMFPTTTTPTAIVTRKGGGRDLNIDGVPATDVDDRVDWDDYATEVVAHYEAEDYDWGITYAVGDTVNTKLWTDSFYECKVAHTSSAFNQPPNATYWDAVTRYNTSTLGSIPYVNPYDGADIVERRVVDAKNVTDYDDAGDVAAQQLGRFDDVNEEVTIESDLYDISATVRAGDGIYVWDPENDLYNKSVEVPYGGRLLHPRLVRVHAVTEACTSDKGYYLRSWNGSAFELHDLTWYVAFESGSVRLECGQPRRRRPLTPTSL